MTRDEALLALHQTFGIWTGLNGCYVGTLEEVIQVPRKPWRAKLRITGVLGVAQHAHQGHACRRGFRPGETMEVGGINIKPLTADEQARSTDYLTALQRARMAELAALARDPHSPYAWATHASAEGNRLALIAEERRLAGEPWALRGPIARYEPAVRWA